MEFFYVIAKSYYKDAIALFNVSEGRIALVAKSSLGNNNHQYFELYLEQQLTPH